MHPVYGPTWRPFPDPSQTGCWKAHSQSHFTANELFPSVVWTCEAEHTGDLQRVRVHSSEFGSFVFYETKGFFLVLLRTFTGRVRVIYEQVGHVGTWRTFYSTRLTNTSCWSETTSGRVWKQDWLDSSENKVLLLLLLLLLYIQQSSLPFISFQESHKVHQSSSFSVVGCLFGGNKLLQTSSYGLIIMGLLSLHFNIFDNKVLIGGIYNFGSFTSLTLKADTLLSPAYCDRVLKSCSTAIYILTVLRHFLIK